jgi:hypothetical protein
MVVLFSSRMKSRFQDRVVCGGALIVNWAEAVPAGVVTCILPVPSVAPDEMFRVAVVVVNWLLVVTLVIVRPAIVVDKAGLHRFVPLIVTTTVESRAPVAGEMDVIVGNAEGHTVTANGNGTHGEFRVFLIVVNTYTPGAVDASVPTSARPSA